MKAFIVSFVYDVKMLHDIMYICCQRYNQQHNLHVGIQICVKITLYVLLSFQTPDVKLEAVALETVECRNLTDSVIDLYKTEDAAIRSQNIWP